METPFEASTCKLSENAGITVADIFQDGEQEHFGTSFALTQAVRSNNVENQNPAVSEMLTGFCVMGASSSDSASAPLEAGANTKTDDGMDVRTFSERVTEAVVSPGGREAFETFINGKPSDRTATRDLYLQFQNAGHVREAEQMVRHLDRMLHSGVDFTKLLNLPRQDFERHLRDRLNRYVNRNNS